MVDYMHEMYRMLFFITKLFTVIETILSRSYTLKSS